MRLHPVSLRSVRSTAVSLMALIAHPVLAEDAALVFGTASYANLGRVAGGADVINAAAALQQAGFTVLSVPNGTAAAESAALTQFAGLATDADRVVAVLSGRFATDGSRTWYLAADSAEPTLLDVARRGTSIETLLAILSDLPGAAVLVLGGDEAATDDFDRWLREGVGDLDIPQGVTVVRGSARGVASFVANGLAVPGGDLAESIAGARGLTAHGYLPRSFAFVPPMTPERHLETGPTPPQRAVDRAAERALWEGAVALDTEAAYVNYLNRYPNGTFAEDAQRRRTEIASEPNRAERLAEEAMQLSRDDRRTLQRALTLLQFDTRGVDGIFGPASRSAIINWQQQNGFPQTGFLTFEQITRIQAQAARRTAELAAIADRERQELSRQDRAYWDETGATGSEPGLRAYLNRFPEGLFANAARTRIAAIETDRRRQVQAEDSNGWNRARTADTLESYEDYIRAFPDGRFVGNAEVRINELSRISDNDARAQAAAAAEVALGLNSLTRQLVEQQLETLGLRPGPVDGTFDPDTRRAIRLFQRNQQLDVTGHLDEQTVLRLLADVLQ